MLPRQHFVGEDAAGFTETLPVNYNDCDFSFKLRFLGLSRIWVANTRAYHFESQTREATTHRWEYEIIARRWTTPHQDRYVPDYGLTRGDIPRKKASQRSNRTRKQTSGQRRTS